MFKKALFVLFSISFHTFTAKIGKRMHSKHPLPSSFAENSWRGRRSDWLTLPFPATKKPKCHQPGINLNSSSPFLISPSPDHHSSPSLPPSFLLHPSPLSYSPPAPPKNPLSFTPNQSSSFSRQMRPCAKQEVHQKSPFFYTRYDTTHHEDGKL